MPSVGVPGVHVWFKLPNVLVFWLELGPRKTPLFLKGGAALAAVAATIAPPWGPIIATVTAIHLAAIKAKAGSKGVWAKFGPLGFMTARTRTDANKEKMPSPF